jgi:nitrous oxide reductase
MRSSLGTRHGLVLTKTPNYRQQATRRRLMAVCAILGLALASGLIGSLTAPKGEVLAKAAATGPFSYFPHQ